MLEEGGALHGAKKSKEDKEREKREKEEEKRRQKEAEKEKKRLEKEKKNKDNTEDRADRLVWKLSLSYFQQTKICPAAVLKQTQKASF